MDNIRNEDSIQGLRIKMDTAEERTSEPVDQHKVTKMRL